MPFHPKLAILIIIVIAFACKGKPAPAKETPPIIVDVIIATQQSISNTIEANGSIIAGESVELHVEVSGRLVYLNVPEGSYVAKGTVMARVNDADLQAQLGKSKVQLALAQKTEERYNQLLTINGINQSDYDIAVGQVNSLKADIAYTQALIGKTIVRAPFSGVVGLRQVSPGAYVTAVDVIATIQQIAKVKIDFTLPEEFSAFVKKGNAIDVEVDAIQQIRKKAIIIAVEPQVNLTTRNLKVRALLQDGTANPGAFVKVYINEASGNKTAILVPTNAVIPDDKNNQLVLVKNGKAVFANVQTGLREAGNVEIVKGVAVGDSVVVTGVLFAKPKGILKIRSVKTLEQLAKQ